MNSLLSIQHLHSIRVATVTQVSFILCFISFKQILLPFIRHYSYPGCLTEVFRLFLLIASVAFLQSFCSVVLACFLLTKQTSNYLLASDFQFQKYLETQPLYTAPEQLRRCDCKEIFLQLEILNRKDSLVFTVLGRPANTGLKRRKTVGSRQQQVERLFCSSS